MAMWKWLYLNVNFSHCVDPILYSAESLENVSIRITGSVLLIVQDK
jgi:hypothetical protein